MTIKYLGVSFIKMPIRKCSECGKTLPETQNNFYFRDKKEGTFRRECILCFRARLPDKTHHLAIYRIKSPLGKVYIGKDQYFPQRMVNHRHISENKNKTEHNSPIHKAIRKYGWENMIVEGVDFEAKSVDELSHREEIWIWLSNSKKKGYNQTFGGEGTKGYKHSAESKRLISKKATGRKDSPETIINKRLASTGRKHSEEAKQKIALGNKGKIVSKSTRKLLSQINSGKTLSEEHRKNISKGIAPYKGVPIPEERRLRIKDSHLNSEFELISPAGRIYITNDLATFAEKNDLSTQHLYKVLNGKRKHHKGWTGKYISKKGEDYEAPKYVEKKKLKEKLVAQISDDGEILGIWYSIGECAKALSSEGQKIHTFERCIAKVLRGERKQTHGMKFKYVANPDLFQQLGKSPNSYKAKKPTLR